GQRAGRTRRGLTWADWSGSDQVPVHAKQVGSSDEEYYRNGIHFELYTVKNPDEPELLDIYSSELDFETVFDARRPTKVAVHGWLSDGLGLIQLRKAFLATSDVNYIAVNWTDIDTIVYPLARYHVSSIAQRVAFLLDFLRIMFGVPLSSVHRGRAVTTEVTTSWKSPYAGGSSRHSRARGRTAPPTSVSQIKTYSRGSFCLYTNDASPFAMDQTKQLKVAANTSTTEPDEQFRARVYRTFMRRGTEYEREYALQYKKKTQFPG
ncbi:hypothetical protein FOCC_FOCC017392, partial [Frankliniella occidentalis]